MFRQATSRDGSLGLRSLLSKALGEISLLLGFSMRHFRSGRDEA